MKNGVVCRQCRLVVDHIRMYGGDWSIGELAEALEIDKSTISARVNELLHQHFMLIECPKRKDRVSGILVRPVALPGSRQHRAGQGAGLQPQSPSLQGRLHGHQEN